MGSTEFETYNVRFTIELSTTAESGRQRLEAALAGTSQELGGTLRRARIDQVDSRIFANAVATTNVALLAFLGFHLNGAAASGKYDAISVQAIKEEIEAGTIFTFLHRELDDDIDLGMIGPAEQEELENEWQALLIVNED